MYIVSTVEPVRCQELTAIHVHMLSQQAVTKLCVLQTVIARETDPLHSQIVSLTRFTTGENAYNVIPDVVKLGATYRSLTHDGMVCMKKRMDEVHPCTS